jgi:hypothetical protein
MCSGRGNRDGDDVELQHVCEDHIDVAYIHLHRYFHYHRLRSHSSSQRVRAAAGDAVAEHGVSTAGRPSCAPRAGPHRTALLHNIDN